MSPTSLVTEREARARGFPGGPETLAIILSGQHRGTFTRPHRQHHGGQEDRPVPCAIPCPWPGGGRDSPQAASTKGCISAPVQALRQDRGGDGGAHRHVGGGPDHLRHVQGGAKRTW